MTMRLPLCICSIVMINTWACSLAVDPVPKEKPTLKCEMRGWTGKAKAILAGQHIALDEPDAAEVEITNISDADVDIGSRWGPYVHLELRVKDPIGKDVKTLPFGAELSTQSLIKPKPYILKPGEVYLCAVNLLGTLPQEGRVIGTYKVKVVYSIAKKDYESDWVEVKWTKKK